MPTSSELRLRLARAGFELQVDTALPGQGITVLFGASGSGKTSVLRCVAGLERAREARVCIGGQVWQDDDAGIFLPTWQRPVGYVFQEASLFDHLDVQGNLAYGLRRAREPGAPAALAQAVELLGIGDLLKRRPDRLSGGERQRVAIARALATQPKVLLLDEPLAALDHSRRQEILPWLERMRDELSMPMLYVTHSADEAVRLASHFIVLDQGQVRAAGPLAQVMTAIEHPVVVGEDAGALLVGQVGSRDAAWHLMEVGFEGGALWVRDSGRAHPRGLRLRVLARDVSIATEAPRGTSIQNVLPCTVDAVAPDAHPSQVMVRLRCGESVLLSRITARAAHLLALHPGRQVWAQVKSVAIVD